ncbi:MAG TPA: hypothetical protein VMT18_07330, partial [Planctomycetota bacterium]|nr:hypothetical protein [Planctomycetota bacterium]
ALATACELGRRAASDPLGGLLAERTRATLARARWRGAAAPPSPAYVAVLLGGLAFVAAIGPAREAATGATLEAALGAVEGLAADADPAEVARALDRLESALAAADPAPSDMREAQRRRAQALERLEAVGWSQDSPGAASGAGGSGPQGAAAAPGGASGAGSGQATLAAGAGDRTMSRPEGPPPMLPDRSTPPSAASGTPPARAAIWPRRHDAVVAGYLERLPRD